MEMLNSVSLLLANNFWAIIIDFFADWIVNYGWAIIVFTICLKLVLSPLDIIQRLQSQKQASANAAMQPEMEELKAKYGNDRDRLNQETTKLYKKYNVSIGGMCFTMLITLLISLVVLFTLYSSIRSYGEEKLYTTYQELDTAYVQAEENYANIETDLSLDEYVATVVQDKYDELSEQNSWLWIKNVWKSDTNTSQFVDFEDYANHYNLTDEDRTLAQTRYDNIVRIIVGDGNDVNGYYVIIILAVLVSFLTQFLSAKLVSKGQKMNMMNKIMMFVIPLTMLILALTSNVVFTLYVIVNSLMTAIISTILTLIIRAKNKNSKDGDVLLKKKNVEVVEYSRNYRK
ncbi:MAG TPA: membrane protein insertase YidC [Candidatus Onthoplasma faecigallinarum]|nr:membrane protein insertase YidC [Candidatus Onthoplasma faecigallinarum]